MTEIRGGHIINNYIPDSYKNPSVGRIATFVDIGEFRTPLKVNKDCPALTKERRIPDPMALLIEKSRLLLARCLTCSLDCRAGQEGKAAMPEINEIQQFKKVFEQYY